LMQKL